MPYVRQHIFLLLSYFLNEQEKICVNALCQATHIPTQMVHRQFGSTTVSMPYVRQHIFLQGNIRFKKYDIYPVSMPYVRQHIFLLLNEEAYCRERYCVNALCQATHIPTNRAGELVTRAQQCGVNALCQATHIPT